LTTGAQLAKLPYIGDSKVPPRFGPAQSVIASGGK
jgi:hypothetical protein